MKIRLEPTNTKYLNTAVVVVIAATVTAIICFVAHEIETLDVVYAYF